MKHYVRKTDTPTLPVRVRVIAEPTDDDPFWRFIDARDIGYEIKLGNMDFRANYEISSD